MPQDDQTDRSSKRRLTELHVIAARGRAVRLFCTASTIFPAEWAAQIVAEQTTVDLSEFSYHARRVIELCGFRNRIFESVDQVRFGLSPGQNIEFIHDLHEALNRLHHVRELDFDWAVWEGEKIFLASSRNLVPSFVRVETDKLPTANISISVLLSRFLTALFPR